ncbi:MAG: hypothetical protein EU541_04105 [Promethearchaeota archaeon]|nr:MAG: hypothetical protein EU541_04105 [Candidatus Lokiarchaeota archaeon]
MSLFEWKPPQSFKNYDLDLNIVKKYATSGVFFHIDKGNSKIVHIKSGQVIYTVGSSNKVQYQLLEALLEYIVKRFNEIFDLDVILSYENVSKNMFNSFKSEVEKILENFNELDLIETIKARCRVCDKILSIHVKKSFIENADDFPVPLVYEHAGHAILIFIDRNFDVRGVELVNTTG